MNTPMASSASVAELTVGYMFALARSTYQAAASMKSENGRRRISKEMRSAARLLDSLALEISARKLPNVPRPWA